MFERRARDPRQPPLSGYPPRIRRLIVWYDSLNDRQRVLYAVAGMLFLLACAGYLLGLGSTLLLQRVEAEEAQAAATVPAVPAVPTEEPIVEASPVPVPTPTPVAPTPTPVPKVPTPFSGVILGEPPVQPRPRAPATATPVLAKPRNREDAPPEPPGAAVRTPTPGVARPTPRPPIAAPVASPVTARAIATPTPLPSTTVTPATRVPTASPTPKGR